MHVLTNEKFKVPVKIWSEKDSVEAGAIEQLEHLAQLPFAYHNIAVMPDVHQGYGMPIGGVLATEGYIIPNAVGVDIGCGMCFISTNIPVSLLQTKTASLGVLGQAIVGNIMRNVPTGFAHHQERKTCLALDRIYDHEEYDASFSLAKELLPEIEAGYYQVGTLGGGNHFIELQADENDMLCIMLHSGSRNFGYKICNYFNEKAKELNQKWLSTVPKEWDLAFLPVDDDLGKAYITWMNLALDFAMENRQAIMEQVKSIVMNMVKKYTDFGGIALGEQINAHHNYAAIEHHFGKNVWIHRKGAIRARGGELGIIPGAMGANSYIVQGLGNSNSFCSASHGAGRKMGRKEASRLFDTQKVIEDMKGKGIFIGKANMEDITEECTEAYKNIDSVIANESDLVTPIKKLRTVCVIKG